MGAYILRRLLLIIPTLFGIMVINFALTQFVPGGPIEQVLARLEGGGDAFQNIAGGRMRAPRWKARAGGMSAISARAGCRPSSSPSWNGSSALTSRRCSASST